MAKRITFDSEIIETLYTSLRQITTIVWRSSGERHTRARMDGVDYLVEDNTRDDFSNWGGSSTIESESTVLKSYSITEETESIPVSADGNT